MWSCIIFFKTVSYLTQTCQKFETIFFLLFLCLWYLISVGSNKFVKWKLKMKHLLQHLLITLCTINQSSSTKQDTYTLQSFCVFITYAQCLILTDKPQNKRKYGKQNPNINCNLLIYKFIVTSNEANPLLVCIWL